MIQTLNKTRYGARMRMAFQHCVIEALTTRHGYIFVTTPAVLGTATATALKVLRYYGIK